jgi:integrase
MSVTKVKLRKRLLPSGKITLYLDFWPPVRDPKTNKQSRREYLGIYLVNKPRTPEDREMNAKKMIAAEGLRSKREIAILEGATGYVDRDTPKEDFLQYFHEHLADHDQKWIRVYDHFKKYCGGSCLMGEITVDFCNGFRDYLLNAQQLRHPNLKLSQNSASGYWSTFRGFLAIAYKDHKISENVNDYLEPIDYTDPHRQYLTLEELQDLADTPCASDVLRRASLFSCLTGLRFGDIRDLTWDKITKYPDGGNCIRITTEKTETDASLPITDEALELCGKRGKGQVFKGLDYALVQKELKGWIEDAGIDKHITFHCFRHTYATLLLSSGADIYVVSKMLTHKNVGTTQIYTDVMDADKRKAAERLQIKKK